MNPFSIFFKEYCAIRGFSVDSNHIPLVNFLQEWKKVPKGWYIWGDVGRGKSTIAKAFYEFYPSKKKLWLHFTEWNILIQRQLALYSTPHTFKKKFFWSVERTPIEKLATDILNLNDIIFLDEFSINHIAEAVITEKLLALLLKKGVKIILTSNTHPNLLYENGLNREHLSNLFTILETQLKVVEISGEQDFRQQKRTKNFNYFLDKQKFEFAIKEITSLNSFTNLSINRGQRTYNFNKTYQNIAVCTFDELCTKDRSLSDYQVLFAQVNKLFLSNLPEFTLENINSVKRFIILIDFLYENNINILIHGKILFEHICSSSLDKAFLKRTFSRLIEMLSV